MKPTNNFKQCNDTECWCSLPAISSNYITVKALQPIRPHTNPAADDLFSMYTRVGGSNECYIMFQDHHDTDTEYVKRDEGHIKRMVLYHTPTGMKIEIAVDLEWLNDPAYFRSDAVGTTDNRYDNHLGKYQTQGNEEQPFAGT